MNWVANKIITEAQRHSRWTAAESDVYLLDKVAVRLYVAYSASGRAMFPDQCYSEAAEFVEARRRIAEMDNE